MCLVHIRHSEILRRLENGVTSRSHHSIQVNVLAMKIFAQKLTQELEKIRPIISGFEYV